MNFTIYIQFKDHPRAREKNCPTMVSILVFITFSTIASCKSFTTSSLTTPEQLKPFVHAVNRADARPSCLQGNENVKPNKKKTNKFYSSDTFFVN